jgi:hypothetical protein
MTEATKRLIELNSQREELTEQFKTINAEIEALIEEAQIPFGEMFQDTDGTVFVVEKPTGTYVEYRNWTIRRTRRQDEPVSSTNLAIKTAEEAGFFVTNKHVKAKESK